ncbi:hypothetical protein E2C01_006998 [Portunus trituberculatus]|uniref:Uncharacterized protein n=1 Tax=Portunus trituberculatus TaxID=210409 RepID=A0A5B7CYA1_PORTR|nr:hypothetical protein [Portunus trituberculatus]
MKAYDYTNLPCKKMDHRWWRRVAVIKRLGGGDNIRDGGEREGKEDSRSRGMEASAAAWMAAVRSSAKVGHLIGSISAVHVGGEDPPVSLVCRLFLSRREGLIVALHSDGDGVPLRPVVT